MNKNKKRGFTLLEVLVVMAIAAMILSFTVVSMRSTKQRSRDARREQDMKQIQDALAIYANSNRGLYPIQTIEQVINGQTDTLSVALFNISAMQGRVPIDPIGGATGICGSANSYVYCYQSNGVTYTIRYALESDTILGKTQAGWCNTPPANWPCSTP